MHPALPEDPERVANARRSLAGRDSEIIDTVERVRERLAADDLILLEHPGVPLRPLFLSRERLDRICGALHRHVVALGQALAADGVDEDLFPFPADVLAATHAREVFQSPRFGLVLRPDGFLFDGHFALSEPNHANGYLISATYPEAVHAVFAALGLADRVEVPVRRIFQMLHAQTRVERPRLALFWHSEEHAIIKDWNARTQGILKWLPRALERDGFDVVFAHEDDLSVATNGDCVCEGKRVDLVLQIPIGTHFLYAPDRLAGGDLAHLSGDRIGHAPFLQPLAHLAIDKGTMPFWQTLPCWAETPDVVPIPTHFPTADRASAYRLEKAQWVLKRSFEGKDTHAGVSANARVWNRALETAMATREYVMQPYVRMSVAPMPVIDRGRVEWISASIELSLFVIDGAYSGAFARFLPEGDGHVLSPPPPNMGFTLVSA